MVWHQKPCGKGCFGSACRLHKLSLLAFFSMDAGKLQLPLGRRMLPVPEEKLVAWHGAAGGGMQNGCLVNDKSYSHDLQTLPPGLSWWASCTEMQNFLRVSKKGVERNSGSAWGRPNIRQRSAARTVTLVWEPSWQPHQVVMPPLLSFLNTERIFFSYVPYHYLIVAC